MIPSLPRCSASGALAQVASLVATGKLESGL
jgi:hypothetical protein